MKTIAEPRRAPHGAAAATIGRLQRRDLTSTRRDRTRTGRWLAFSLCAGLTASPAAAQSPIAYRDLVERYRDDPVGAAEELSSWTRRAVERMMASSSRTGALASPRPAAMLHTERALADLAAARGDSGELHLAAAAVHVARLGRSDFARRWHLAVGQYMLLGSDPIAAERILERAVDAWPDDPDALVARGAVDEFVGSLPVHGSEDEQWRSLSSPVLRELRREQAERRRQRERAVDRYRKALDVDPGHEEARLRLGSALQRAEAAGARAELEWVLEHATSADLRYLAALLLGRADEAEDRLAAAEARFEAALAELPGRQAASVALSHLLLRRGRRAEALHVARLGLDAQAGLPEDADPWWFFPQGRPGATYALLATLRHEARTQP